MSMGSKDSDQILNKTNRKRTKEDCLKLHLKPTDSGTEPSGETAEDEDKKFLEDAEARLKSKLSNMKSN